jgi:hypothetical protein
LRHLRSAVLGFTILTASAIMPAGTFAQSRLQVTPFLASYYPLTSLNQQTNVALPLFLNNPPGNITSRQEPGPMIGARAGYPLSGVFRLEGEFGWAFSSGRVSYAAAVAPDNPLNARASAHVYMATGRLVIRPRRRNFFGLIGGGIVGHGGDAWKAADQSVRPAGVAGLGLHSSVSPSFGVDIQAEVFLYNMSYTSPTVTTAQSKFQQDVVVSIGVPIPGR